MKYLLLTAIAVWTLFATSVARAQNTWTFDLGSGASVSTSASVTPLMYGKTWAYSFETDDGGINAWDVAYPLFSSYQWSDAPAGKTGGNLHNFIGSMAIFPLRLEANSTYVTDAQVKTMMNDGWGVENHSYWHSGSYGAPFPDDQYRRELFWSQQILGMKFWDGQQAPIALVYPNGDVNYKSVMGEYGIVTGTRVGGSKKKLTPGTSFDDVGRNYLDDGYWTGSGGGNPMAFFPGSPSAGDWVIDFTHGIGTPGSANHTRWQTRLQTIMNTYGPSGLNNMWVATTEQVTLYDLAQQQAQVSIVGGELRVTLPDSVLATPLTIRIDNLDPNQPLSAPAGGLLYRDGSTAWLTTPTLNSDVVNPVPMPEMFIAYEGNYADHVDLPEATTVAAVRVRSFGDPPFDVATPQIKLIKGDGSEVLIDVSQVLTYSELGSGFGKWYLFPLLPTVDAVTDVVAVEMNGTNAIKYIEVYALPVPEPTSLVVIVPGALASMKRARRR